MPLGCTGTHVGDIQAAHTTKNVILVCAQRAQYNRAQISQCVQTQLGII